MIFMPITVENTVSLFHYYIEDRSCSDWQYFVDDLFEKITKKGIEIENNVCKDKLMSFVSSSWVMVSTFVNIRMYMDF